MRTSPLRAGVDVRYSVGVHVRGRAMTWINFQTWDEERDLVWKLIHWEVLEQTGLLVRHAVDDHAKLDALP